MAETTGAAIPEEMEKVISYIENLTLLQAKQLADALKERLGVEGGMMMGAMPAMAGPAAAAPVVEEKTEFNVILTAFAADKKIGVIKEVRAITGLGLKEAKELVEGAPKPIKEGANKEEAQELKTKLEAAGGTVELK